MEVGGQRHAPAALPPGKTQYPLYRRLGGPQSWSGQARKISPPPGFYPRNVQHVASNQLTIKNHIRNNFITKEMHLRDSWLRDTQVAFRRFTETRLRSSK